MQGFFILIAAKQVLMKTIKDSLYKLLYFEDMCVCFFQNHKEVYKCYKINKMQRQGGEKRRPNSYGNRSVDPCCRSSEQLFYRSNPDLNAQLYGLQRNQNSDCLKYFICKRDPSVSKCLRIKSIKHHRCSPGNLGKTKQLRSCGKMSDSLVQKPLKPDNLSRTT